MVGVNAEGNKLWSVGVAPRTVCAGRNPKALALNGGTPLGPRAFPDWPLTNELDEQNILKPLRGHRWCTYDTENLIPEFEKALRRRYE